MIFLSDSAEATKDYAEKLACELVGGEIILLDGDLGAGKTTFAKGLARGLGIKENVVSPTFVIHCRYESGRLTLNHFDMYRITDAVGLEEYIFEEGAVSVIEWAENIKDILPDNCIRICLKRSGDEQRIIERI